MRNYSHLLWQQKRKTVLDDLKIFKTIMIDSVSPGGRNGKFVQLDSPDWVNVVCVIKNEKNEDCFLLVKQFRHGSNSITAEFPAGLVDKNENPKKAAARELLEETGYKANSLILIGKANPDPAFMNNTSYTYLAVNPLKAKKQSLDDDEIIDVEFVPIKTFEAKMGSGEYINAITLVSYLWYKKYTEAN